MTSRPPVEETLMAATGWGELEPGIVYSASTLARRYAAPVPAVRAALTALSRDGLFRPVPGRGYRLTEPTDEELAELVELRLLLEVPMARRAAEDGVSDADLAVLRRLAAATVPTDTVDLIRYIRADLEFHLHLVALGGNDRLVEVVRLLRTRSRIPAVRPVAGPFVRRNAEEHLAMVDLCASGDGAKLDALLRSHISRPLKTLD